jgi:anti-sigma factor RsiW
MIGTGCLGGPVLLLYSAGELTDKERAEADAHLSGCVSCRRQLSELDRLTEVIKAIGRAEALAMETRRGAPRCPEDEELAAYADGSLRGERADKVERHVATCRSCLREVADLWRLAGPATHDAPEASVAAVVARLDAESRTAVVRFRDRALTLVEGFGSSLRDAVTWIAPEPVPAMSRSAGGPLSLRWVGPGGARIEAEITREAAGVVLTGRVTADGRPLPAVSVSMRSGALTSGPESPDSSGRFGPWPLDVGENVISVSGLQVEEGTRAELTVVLEADREAGGEVGREVEHSN